MKLTIKILITAIMASGALAGAAHAAGGETRELKHGHWSFTGITGSYDKDAVQRGFQVYREVCAACHSLDFIAFRHLGDKGGPFYMETCPEGFPDSQDCRNPADNPVVKALAAEYEVEDGPDDGGDMFMRPGLAADYVPGPYANDKQAAAANGGAVPPDLSLITKARHHGTDYLYSLLTGYEAPPDTITVAEGTFYNPYFPGDTASLLKPEYMDEEGHILDGVKLPEGGVLKMKSPLADGIVDYADETTPETVEQYAADVAHFLTWAGEPKLESRKQMGFITLIYLFIFAGIVYASYKQIWSNVEH